MIFVVARARILGGVTMRSFLICGILLLSAMLDSRHSVQAQPYCAMYDDGTKSCGIPTLQSCDQSVSGVGGYCAPDMTSQMRPDLFHPLQQLQQLQQPQQPFDPAYQPPGPPLQLPTPGVPYTVPPPGGGNPSSNLDWVPPPPGQ
jgi:hypothetical protein